MTTETGGNVIEHRCSMTARVLMGIIPGKPFYIYVVLMTAKPANLPKIMIATYALRAPACIFHTRMMSRTC